MRSVILLPVAVRELQVAARRPLTHRIRLLIAGLAVMVGIIVVFVAGLLGTPGRAGQTMFSTMAWGALAFALAAGSILTSESIAGEHRDGTLGLLFLTDLTGFDVLAGKLLGGGLSAATGLLAAFPVASIAWLLGGVTGAEFLQVTLVLLNSLFLSLSLGLWVSSRLGSTGWNLALSLVGMVVLCLVPMALARSGGIRGIPPDWLECLGPAGLLGVAVRPGNHGRLFWTGLTVQHLLAWSCLLSTSRMLPRLRTMPAVGPRAASAPALEAGPAAGNRIEGSALRRERLEGNPVEALVIHRQAMARPLWLAIGASLLAQAVLLPANPGILGFPWRWLGGTHAWVMLPIALHFTWQACRFFAETRRLGMLELLLTTPLTDTEIIRGQFRALHHAYRRPLTLWCVGYFLLSLAQGWNEIGSGGNLPWTTFKLSVDALYGMGSLLVALHACMWAGFWHALTRPSPLEAFTRTALIILVAPFAAPCVPTVIINLFQASWFRGYFSRNLKSILQSAGAR